MNVKGIPDDTLVVKLPVWTSGYYKIIDYPINRIGFKATSNIAECLSWHKNSMANFSHIPSKSDLVNYKDWLFFMAHEFFNLYNV